MKDKFGFGMSQEEFKKKHPAPEGFYDKYGFWTANKDPRMMVLENLLDSTPPQISHKLDDLAGDITDDLLKYTKGDPSKAIAITNELNNKFVKNASGEEQASDWWDYWSKSLPAIYNDKESSTWKKAGNLLAMVGAGGVGGLYAGIPGAIGGFVGSGLGIKMSGGWDD